MTPARYLRIVRVSALYDLLVSSPFASPWTAALVLSSLGGLHRALGVGGAPPSAMTPLQLVFVAFFGTVVTMWSLLRLLRPRLEHGLVDGLGRLAFSVWQGWALAQGESHLLAVFLVAELGFGAAQLGGWALLPRRGWRMMATDADR